jgi:hypothetical protein
MAITATERTQILQLLVMMFDAAPGATYLSDVTAIYEANGHNLEATALVLGTVPIFNSLHPNFQTASDFATDMLSTVGLENDSFATDWVISRFNAGEPKAQIMFEAWQALENLPDGVAPQYTAAALELNNKATVSEYYSVTLGGHALDVATLQDLLKDVDSTDASVAAAEQDIDQMLASIQPPLTPQVDNIHVLGTAPALITGIVDGDADGNTANATFNPGDSIEGNGHTFLDLLVVENGNAGFERLTNIEVVNITAGTDASGPSSSVGITFNAAQWNDVGLISLNDGVNGELVFIDHLKAETDIEVTNVTGSLSASYSGDTAGLYAWLRNNDSGGDGIHLHFGDDANVTIDGADSVSAYISNTTGTIGDINASFGDSGWFQAYFDPNDGFVGGNVHIAMGDSSTAYYSVDDTEGNLTVGSFDISMGDTGFASVTLFEVWGDVSVSGDVNMMAGDSSELIFGVSEVFTTDSGTETVGGNVLIAGAIDMSVGNSGDIDVYFNDIEGSLTLSGDVTLVAGDTSDVDLTFGEDGTVNVNGNIDVTVGNSSSVTISGEDFGGDATFQDITVKAGTSSTVNITFDGGYGFGQGGEDIAGAFSMGNVSVSASTSSNVGLAVYSWSSASVGDVDLTVNGGMGSIDVSFSSITTTLDVGAVNLKGGEESHVEFGVHNIGASPSLEYGEDHGNGTVNIVSISATGGDVRAWVSNSGNGFGTVNIGNIDLDATTGAAYLTVADNAEINLGAITVSGATDADVYIESESRVGYTYTTTSETSSGTVTTTVTVDGVIGDVVVGDITVSLTGDAAVTTSLTGEDTDFSFDGEDSHYFNTYSFEAHSALSVTIDAYGFNVGNVDVGDVVLMNDSDNSGVHFYVSHTATAETSDSNDGTAAGNVTVGDITLTAGNATHLSVTTTTVTTTSDSGDTTTTFDIVHYTHAGEDGWNVNASVSIENHASDGDVGDILIGDVSLTVGNGFASGTETNEALDWLGVYNFGTHGNAGSITVGNVSMTGGDFATLSASIENWANGDGSVTGAVAVGNVTMDAGESANEVLQVYNYASGDVATSTTTESGDTIGMGVVNGGITVGNIAMSADQDSSASVSISAWNYYNNGQSMGDMTVGNVSQVLGDNSTARVNVEQWGNFASETSVTGDKTDGDYKVGNVSVSVSATTDEDLSGGSSIEITLEKGAASMTGFTSGKFTVGDVMASAAGAHASINIAITDTATADLMGDVSIGQVGLMAGDSVDAATIYVGIGNFESGGDIGNVSVGGGNIEIGDDSQATMTVSVDKVFVTQSGDPFSRSGDIGNVSFGDYTLDAGDSSTIDVNLYASLMDSSEIGDVTIGNVNATVGENGTINMDSLDFTAGTMGNVGIGNVTLNAGEDAAMHVSANWYASTGDVGDASFGDVTINGGMGSVVSYTMEVTAENVGDVNIGNWAVVAPTGSEISQLVVSVSATDGDVGAVSAGSVNIVAAAAHVGYNSVTAPDDFAGIWVDATGSIGGVDAGPLDVTVYDGAYVDFTYFVAAANAGDMTIDGMTLHDLAGATFMTATTTGDGSELTTATFADNVGGTIHVYATLSGDANDDLTVGDFDIAVSGTQDADEVWVELSNNGGGDINIGNVKVSGAGLFFLDGMTHEATDNASFISVNTSGDVSIGDVDFTGYQNDISIDLSTWTDSGGNNITAGDGDDTVVGNADDNVIAGGKGVDSLDISDGGNDTIVTNKGDTGDSHTTDPADIDTVDGFTAGTVSAGVLTGDDADKLDFNNGAGSAGNFVIGDSTYGVAGSLAEFISDANDALNTTVKYFAETNSNGDTWVAVNYGSGEADAIVLLTGVNATDLHFQNIVA